MKKNKQFRKEIIDGEETFVGYYDLNQMTGEEIYDDFIAEEALHNKNRTYIVYETDDDILYAFYKVVDVEKSIPCHVVEVPGYENCFELIADENDEFIGYVFFNFFKDKVADMIENFPFVDRDFQRDILPEILYCFEQFNEEGEA